MPMPTVIPGYVEAMSINPTREINSSINLSDWLGTLSALDHKMLALRVAGYTWKETGAAVGVPMKQDVERVHESWS